MTGPTPEHLRALSGAAENLPRDNEHEAEVVCDVVDALTEAANRIAFLEERVECHALDKRKEIAGVMTDPEQMRALADRADEAGAYEVMETEIVDELATNVRAAAGEVDRLRTVLENAPHDSRCTIHPEPGYTPNCTCWKAKL